MPNAVETNSILSDSSPVDSTNTSDEDTQLQIDQNVNLISDKNYEDPDKLLENVLMAYSQSKHQDLPSKDSNNVDSNDLVDVNNMNKNEKFESDNDISNNLSNDVHHDDPNTDVEESAINIDHSYFLKTILDHLRFKKKVG